MIKIVRQLINRYYAWRYNRAINKLNRRWSKVKREMGTALVPTLRELVRTITELIP